MAGIGFELKKLFKKEGILNTVAAGLHSTAVTIGPMLTVIISLNIIYALQPYLELAYREREVLSSIILYVFIFSLILVSPINVVMSRYMADSIYKEDYGAIYAACETGSVIIAGCVFLVGAPYAYLLYSIGGLPLYYVVVSYIFFTAVSFTFYYMNFITVLKKFSMITYSYIASLVIGIMFVVISSIWFNVPISDAIVYGLTISFSLIAMFLLTFIRLSFNKAPQKSYKEVFAYFRKYAVLAMTNFCYVFGMYVHNFIFWIKSDYSITVNRIIVFAPNYDMATYLAMLSNISILVVFVVSVETKFHTAYKQYCESIIGAGGKDMKRAKQRMVETLRHEIIFIVQVQIIINLVVYIIAQIFLPRLGIEGITFNMYPVLSVGYMMMYLIQCFMIYLYYLDDSAGAAMTSVVFLAANIAGSIFSVNLPPELSGIGIIFGSAAGLAMAFFRLRYKLINLDRHIYGRGKIVNKIKRNRKREVITVYSEANKNKGGDSN